MTIPTNEQFREFFELIDKLRSMPFDLPDTITQEQAATFLEDLERQDRENDIKACAVGVTSWFFSDPSVQRARRLVRGKKKTKEKIEWDIRSEVDGIFRFAEQKALREVTRLETLYQASDDYLVPWEYRSQPEQWASETMQGERHRCVVANLHRLLWERPSRKYWDLSWMRHFAEYFEAQAVPRALDAMAKMKRLQDAAAALQAASDTHHAAVLALADEGHIRHPWTLRAREAGPPPPPLPKALSRSHQLRDPLPIRRNGAHARERVLVYRLWQTNRRHFRAAKPEAIAELMNVEGVEHQYDARTIEKMCAEFTGLKKSR